MQQRRRDIETTLVSKGKEKTQDISSGSTMSLRCEVTRVRQEFVAMDEDSLAVEEPLEIRLDYEDGLKRREKSVSITMRTPGHDAELALGFLLTEGLIREISDIESVGHCGPALPHLGHSNVLKLRVADQRDLKLDRLDRHFYTSSSCGVCG